MGIGQQGYLQTGLMRHLEVVGELQEREIDERCEEQL